MTEAAFEAWWQQHGQFCRAGGGDYEKTFAYRAWQAAQYQALDAAAGAALACAPAEANDVWGSAYRHVAADCAAAIRALPGAQAQGGGA